MRTTDPLHSRNLVPFKKRLGSYHIPGLTREDERSIEHVDHDLSPEEQSFIRHYLGYADLLINSVPEESAEEQEEPSQSDTGTENPGSEHPGSEHKDPTHKAA